MDRKEHYRNSQEIDLIHLFLTILCRWRVLVIAVIIGTILGGGFSYYKQNIENAQSDPDAPIGNTVMQLSTSKLSDMEVAKGYYDTIAQEKEWVDNSPIAQMGYDEGCKGIVLYSIKGKDTKGIDTVYSELIKSQGFYEIIVRKGIIDFPAKYLSEVIAASTRDYDLTYSLGDGNSEVTINNNITDISSLLVTYSVVSVDEETAKGIIEAIDSYVNDYYAKDGTNRGYTLEKLDSFYERYNPAVSESNSIQTHLSNRYKANQEYDKILKTFSDDEISYFNREYLRDDSDKVDVVEAPEAGKISDIKSYAKYIIIGVLLSGFIAAGVICCIYIFDGTVKTANELVALGVSVYGVKAGAVGAGGAGAVGAGKKRGTALDRWLQGLLKSCSGLTLTSDYVTKSLQLQGLENIFIYNNTSLASGEGICDIKSWDGVSNVHISDSAACLDRDSLIKAKELGNELIVVELNKSKTKELIAELETADIQKIKVVGVVCV